MFSVPLVVIGSFITFCALGCIGCDEMRRSRARKAAAPNRDYFTKQQEEEIKQRWYNERFAPVQRYKEEWPIQNPGLHCYRQPLD
jgi:23S rRNA G2069 N7-methylase RlmK/C1962 C5-methylase RlmI